MQKVFCSRTAGAEALAKIISLPALDRFESQ
jgi:hypothetical protein